MSQTEDLVSGYHTHQQGPSGDGSWEVYAEDGGRGRVLHCAMGTMAAPEQRNLL